MIERFLIGLIAFAILLPTGLAVLIWWRNG